MSKIDDSIMKKLMTNLTITKYIKKNKLDNLLQWTAKKFVVNSALQQLVVGVDGEREEYHTPVVIVIKPQALRLMVPTGISHQRPASPFGKETLGELARDVSGR